MASVREYGRWLREQREGVRPKLSRLELARLAHVSHTYIAKLENMADIRSRDILQEPRIEKVDQISQALEQFSGRPLVNEARQQLGYALRSDVPLPGSPEAETWKPGGSNGGGRHHPAPLGMDAEEDAILEEVLASVMRISPERQARLKRILDRALSSRPRHRDDEELEARNPSWGMVGTGAQAAPA